MPAPAACRSLRREVQPDIRFAHQARELAVNQAHEGLARREAAHDFLAQRLGAHRVDEMLHYGERDVRFEQRNADLAQRFLDMTQQDRLLALPAERLFGRLQCGSGL